MSDHHYSRQSKKKSNRLKHKLSSTTRQHRSSHAKKWIKHGVLAIFSVIMLMLISGAGVFAYYAHSAPALTDEDLYGSYYSTLLDKNGEAFYKLGTDSREFAAAEDYPDILIDAVKSIEDQRFDSHNGFDIIGISRAAFDYLRAGNIVSGGSTITQQLVKLSVFSTLQEDQTLKRKAQEIWLSIQLERRLSKEQIMTLYLNKVHMAGNVYGMATAASEYYGKHVSDLSLHEAALLAGLPQSPNNYNPYTEPERAKQRRDEVLTAMYQNGKISKDQMDEAHNIPVEQGLQDLTEHNTENSLVFDSYLSTVLDEVYEKTDFDPYKAGLTIHTNYDASVQETLYDVAHDENFISLENAIQTAITVVDPQNGEILGILGGRNLQGQLSYNRATKNRRNTGSTMKPLSAYGPAIEFNHYSTHEQIVDEPYSPADTNWEFSNYDNQYWGQMSLREALVQSRNIPAAKLFNEYLNVSDVESFISKLGLDPKEVSNANGLVPSNSIDGIMSPLQLAGAYSAFANDGIYTEPHTVNKIVTQNGQEIDLKPESARAMEDYTAYMITDILKGVPANIPEINIPGVFHAGKTGTTNYTDEQFEQYGIPKYQGLVPDSWYVGYSKKFVISTWVGYDTPFEPGHQLSFSDITHRLPRYYFNAIMNRLSQHVEQSDWIKPNSVSELPVVVGSSPPLLANRSTSSYRISNELFVSGTEPQRLAPVATPVETPETDDETQDEDDASTTETDIPNNPNDQTSQDSTSSATQPNSSSGGTEDD